MSWWQDYDKPKCTIHNVCPHSKNCTKTCCGYYQSQLMFDASNLPKRALEVNKLVPEKVDQEAYRICSKYKDNVLEYTQKGYGIYIFSKNIGNGKTTWAYKIGLEYIKQTSLIPEYNGSVYFVNVSELFEFLRINLNNKELLWGIEDKIMNSELVIFDDLGVEAPTEWVSGKLYNYINHRYTNGKAMVFTSNLDYGQVAERVGSRIMDRISDVCKRVEFKGVSRRRNNTWWDD